MTTLRIDTEDSKILQAVKAILETFEVPFEEIKAESPYDPDFVQKIHESEQQIREGKSVTFKKGTNLWDLVNTK